MLLSTRNRGKVREMQALLDGFPVKLISLDDVHDPPVIDEDAPTLSGNARKKAHVLHVETGFPTLADDTGLEVLALGGAPGVHSARYAGPHADDRNNRRKLLDVLHQTADRRARFRTVAALSFDGDVVFFEGVCHGRITRDERGEAGFGYDPVFQPDGHEHTFAEMTAEEKNAISHRAVAMRKVRAFLARSARCYESSPV